MRQKKMHDEVRRRVGSQVGGREEAELPCEREDRRCVVWRIKLVEGATEIASIMREGVRMERMLAHKRNPSCKRERRREMLDKERYIKRNL